MSTDQLLFTAPDAWLGGFYEIGMDLGSASNETLARTFARIWSHHRSGVAISAVIRSLNSSHR
jgi:hypothetical protein